MPDAKGRAKPLLRRDESPSHREAISDRFAKLSSLIVAALSLGVSVLSVWFTVSAQRTDQGHRELLIQPRLSSVIYPEDIRIEIKNVGLGPADIKRVIFESATYRFDSDVDEVVHEKFASGLLNGFNIIESKPGLFQLVKRWLGVSYRFGIFDKGEAMDLIAFDKAGFEASASAEAKSALNPARVDAFKAELWSAKYSAKLRICYCSLTGKFCTFLDVFSEFRQAQCRDDSIQ